MAQPTINPPSIRCVSIDSAGDATITWVLPTNMNGNWVNFTLYYSSSRNFSSSIKDTVITNPTQTSITIPNNSFTISPNVAPAYFYIQTNSTVRDTNSDTISSIFLYVTGSTSNQFANLNWNVIHTPPPQGQSTWYKIYREYHYVWTLIDSTQFPLNYIDTITYCSAYLNYKVEIEDSNVCVSSSNWNGGGIPFVSYSLDLPQAIMDTISVTPSNTINLSWAKSTKDQVVGYVLSVYNGSTIEPFDTVHGINSTSYTYTVGNPSDSSLSFEVQAIDSCHNTGALSNIQHTLFLQQFPDLCKQTNTLKWNRYVNLTGDTGSSAIGGYKIYYSVNNQPFQLLTTTPNNVTTYTDTDLTTREYRCYYVQVYSSLNATITASSNTVCDSINTITKPKNNYLRTATVIFNTSSINILGYVDSSSHAGYYVFQRSADSTGLFLGIDTIVAPTNTDSISYIDNSANPDAQRYNYRILTLNGCKRSIDTSNLGQTIYLTATAKTSTLNTITWNDYGGWYANPAYYLIYRSTDGINYNLLSTASYINAGQNTYSDNISGFTTGQGAFYYYIKAVENNTGLYPFTDTSLSNIAIAYQNPTVFIPNAFCPNGVNKIFKPVGVFINVQGYDLSVLNRWGDLIFESNDPNIGWDGTNKGTGKKVEEGVYLYLLTYTSSKGEYFQRTGTVTLLK